MTTTPLSIPRKSKAEREQMPAFAPHMSLAGLAVVWVVLLLLLAGSALVSFCGLGPWVLVVELVVSVAQMALVMWFFMHVRFATRLTWVFVSVGFVWLAILFGLTFSDYLTRMWLPRMDDIANQTPVLPAPPGVHVEHTPTPHAPLRYQKPSDTYAP